MQRIKLVFLISFVLVFAVLFQVTAQKSSQTKKRQSRLAAYRNNSCVSCHSRLTEPLTVSAHFYEWLNSSHEKRGVSCEKCHGGNPTAEVERIAHQGVSRASFSNSTLHPKNLSDTCGACHSTVADAFTRSNHFRQLLNTGSAPSCSTCHQHMATKVIYWPPETTALCANCHTPKDNVIPGKTDVAKQAGDVISAFLRGDEVIEWSHYLIREAKKKNHRFPAQEAELARLAVLLKEAKLNFHAFDLDGSRKKADQVFTRGNKVKDLVWQKVD